MQNNVTIARDVVRRSVTVNVDGKIMALIAGQSGCGKSELNKTLCLEAAKKLRDKLSIVILDPKIVSFLGWSCRADVFTNINEYKLVLDSLYNEMLRRYQYMAEQGVSKLIPTSEMPYILLVVEEISAITQDQTLIKQERDYIIAKLKSLSSRMRQASMGLIVVSQTADTAAIPSEIRNNLDIRFAMKCGNEQASQLQTGDRAEEAPSYLLSLPGEAYALTNTTNSRFIRCRGLITDREDEVRTLKLLSSDKPHLKCFDWSSKDYVG